MPCPAAHATAHMRAPWLPTERSYFGAQMVHLAHRLFRYKRLWPSDQGNELLVTMAKFWRRLAVSLPGSLARWQAQQVHSCC